MTSYNSVLYLWNGKAAFIGQSTDTVEHRHHAVQIIIGLDSGFRLKSGQVSKKYQAAIIAPNTSHQLDGQGAWQLILLLEPETTLAIHVIQKYLEDTEIKALDFSMLALPLNRLRHEQEITKECETFQGFYDDILHQLLGEEPAPKKSIDSRILEAIRLLQRLDIEEAPTKELAKKVYLSESRLAHLFKEEMGIPIRRYLLWSRLLSAINTISRGENFTNAAHAAGFADSAHLSRTFKKMFGLTLKEIFNNSQFIQVRICVD